MVFDDLIEARGPNNGGMSKLHDETASVDAQTQPDNIRWPAILPSPDLRLDERLGAFASYHTACRQSPWLLSQWFS